MASTSNAENFMKVARIVYQLCDYTDFRADFLQTRICGKWLVFANQVTYVHTYICNSNMLAYCTISTQVRALRNKHVMAVGVGRYHTAVSTSTEVYTFGKNLGQLGYDKVYVTQIVPRAVSLMDPVCVCVCT